MLAAAIISERLSKPPTSAALASLHRCVYGTFVGCMPSPSSTLPRRHDEHESSHAIVRS